MHDQKYKVAVSQQSLPPPVRLAHHSSSVKIINFQWTSMPTSRATDTEAPECPQRHRQTSDRIICFTSVRSALHFTTVCTRARINSPSVSRETCAHGCTFHSSPSPTPHVFGLGLGERRCAYRERLKTHSYPSESWARRPPLRPSSSRRKMRMQNNTCSQHANSGQSACKLFHARALILLSLRDRFMVGHSSPD